MDGTILKVSPKQAMKVQIFIVSQPETTIRKSENLYPSIEEWLTVSLGSYHALPFPAEWLGTSYSTSLCLYFSMYQLGMIIDCTSKLHELFHVKCWESVWHVISAVCDGGVLLLVRRWGKASSSTLRFGKLKCMCSVTSHPTSRCLSTLEKALACAKMGVVASPILGLSGISWTGISG